MTARSDAFVRTARALLDAGASANTGWIDWTERRSPDSERALLEAGASMAGMKLPTGYDEVDKLLRQHLI